MDKKQFALLEADLRAQQATIERVFGLLELRASGLTVESPPEMLESVAYQVHNLYGAIEDLLKIIATYFENHISDSAQWYSRLLQRMTQNVEGVRPAVISQESYLTLNALRAFRHFFRHAYGIPIEPVQLMSNLGKAIALKNLLKQDIAAFVHSCKQP